MPLVPGPRDPRHSSTCPIGCRGRWNDVGVALVPYRDDLCLHYAFDITERSAAALQVEESEAKYRGILTFANPALARLLGFAFIHEITGRKGTEEALRQAAERFENVTNTAMDAFWSTDVDGRILDTNAAALRMYGYTREEMLSLYVQPGCRRIGRDGARPSAPYPRARRRPVPGPSPPQRRHCPTTATAETSYSR
jgi:PAS domain-containing protein